MKKTVGLRRQSTRRSSRAMRQSPLEHSHPNRKELFQQGLELMGELHRLYAAVCVEVQKIEVNLDAETRQRIKRLVEGIKVIQSISIQSRSGLPGSLASDVNQLGNFFSLSDQDVALGDFCVDF